MTRKTITNAQARNSLLASICKLTLLFNKNLPEAYNDVLSRSYAFAVKHAENEFFDENDYRELVYNGLFNNRAFPEKMRYFLAWYCGGRTDAQELFFDEEKAGLTVTQFKTILRAAVDKHIATVTAANDLIGKTAEICAKMPINQAAARNIRAMRTWCDNNGYEGEFGDLLVYQMGYLQGIQAERARRKERTE